MLRQNLQSLFEGDVVGLCLAIVVLHIYEICMMF